MMGKSDGGFSEAGLRRLLEVLAGHCESRQIPGLPPWSAGTMRRTIPEKLQRAPA
ncbi:hypothetical protein [Nonomuraea turcica]|uniref:hypothetical protein n=1 Tax=Nonomuraea sp. G32 TaxID=3067274 RepID=UPI00273C3896|nr:hypothetical protein [Nonomuraea sp. G32]MDP4510373.1 hypothetical protein [Nonomuraea sp. G32]